MSKKKLGLSLGLVMVVAFLMEVILFGGWGNVIDLARAATLSFVMVYLVCAVLSFFAVTLVMAAAHYLWQQRRDRIVAGVKPRSRRDVAMRLEQTQLWLRGPARD